MKVKVELSFFCDTIILISGGIMTKLSVDREKFSRTIKEAIIHKKYFSLVCVFLLNSFKSSLKEEEIAMVDQLTKNFLKHDNSKLEDILEFVALTSIVDFSKDMRNINNHLLEAQRKMISFHWLNNLHHYEHHVLIGKLGCEMNCMELAETACDLQARGVQMENSALEFLKAQQGVRYYYDDYQLSMLNDYLHRLDEAMADIEFPRTFDLDSLFKNNDPVVEGLLRLPDMGFADRLVIQNFELEKVDVQDYFMITYIVKDKKIGKTIGELNLYCNNKLYYTVPKEYEKMFLESLKESFLEIGNINALELMDEQLFDYQEGQGVLTYNIKKGNLS